MINERREGDFEKNGGRKTLIDNCRLGGGEK